MMDGSSAVGRALGHIRNAVVAFVTTDDGSGESLFLAAECLELEGTLAELGVTPEPVDPGLDAVESLRAASRELNAARSSAAQALCSGIEMLLARISLPPPSAR